MPISKMNTVGRLECKNGVAERTNASTRLTDTRPPAQPPVADSRDR